MSDNDALQIWLQYKQSPDPHLRERLILILNLQRILSFADPLPADPAA